MIFLVVFERDLGRSVGAIAWTARISAIAGLVLLPSQFSLEAARMTGGLSGVLDLEMQRFAITTPGVRVLLLRMAGLVLLLASLSRSRVVFRSMGMGACLP